MIDTKTHRRIHDLRAQGLTHQQIADKLASEGVVVNRSSVTRTLQHPPVEMDADELAARVEVLAAALGDLDAVRALKLELLRALVTEAQALQRSGSASSGTSVASVVVKALELINELAPADQAAQVWLADVFSGQPEVTEADRWYAALGCIASGRSDGSPDYQAPRYTAQEARKVARRALYPDASQGDHPEPER